MRRRRRGCNRGSSGRAIGRLRSSSRRGPRRAGGGTAPERRRFRSEDLAEVDVTPESPVEKDAGELPSALDRLDDIITLAKRKRLVVFLDYDGTLTPIVAHPEDAVISEGMRNCVRALSRKTTVAVVSGRDLRGVRSLVGIDELLYAGSHGFEIAGPAGWRADYEHGTSFLPLLDHVQRELETALAAIRGSQVERKKFSVAAHYRNVAARRRTAGEARRR